MSTEADAGETKAIASAQRETDVVAECNKRFKLAKAHSADWRKEAKELYDLKAGHQWSKVDKDLIESRYGGTYPTLTFNVAGKYLDAVEGLQINNRQEMRYYPRKPGGSGVDEYANGVAKWTRDQCEAEDEESDAFGDMILTGMGWIEHSFEDDIDPEGYIAQERRDGLEMYWDPSARKKNLTDRRWQLRVKRVSPEEYRDLTGEDANTQGALDSIDPAGEDSPKIITLPFDYSDTEDGSQQPTGVYMLDYQWFEDETTVAVTADLGDGAATRNFTPKEWRALKTELDAGKIKYDFKQSTNRCYYRSWICSNTIKGGIKKLEAKAYTFECITGKRDRNTNTWFGLGRALVDPSKWGNKLFSSILYALATNAKGGIMAEAGAFENWRKAEDEWANPSKITKLADGALSNNRIEPRPMPEFPAQLSQMMQFSLDALPLTSGLNPEMLGMAGQNQPGVLEAQRKQAALAIIAWAFDSMRRYYKRSGKLLLTMVRLYVPEGRLVRILGPQGAQYVPLIKDKLSMTYDIVVDEAPTSVNMQERTWAIMQSIIPLCLESGIKIPPEVMDYLPLPPDLIQKWKAFLNPTAEEQQDQQTQKQLAVRGAAGKIAVDETKAQLQMAQTETEQQPQQNPAIVASIKANAEVGKAAMEASSAALTHQSQSLDRQHQTIMETLRRESDERMLALENLVKLHIAHIPKPQPATNGSN